MTSAPGHLSQHRPAGTDADDGDDDDDDAEDGDDIRFGIRCP